MIKQKIAPVHPGEILQEEFIIPFGLNHDQLATAINISIQSIKEIVLGKRAITAEIALRLARYFGTSAELWMNLQSLYELETARDEVESKITKEIVPLPHLSTFSWATANAFPNRV